MLCDNSARSKQNVCSSASVPSRVPRALRICAICQYISTSFGIIGKGQWSFSLNGPYRLIVTPLEHPIPLTPNGQFDWQVIRGAVILEIVNYHKEGD